MKYREMIKHVQLESGFSDAESKDALEAAVESIAVRLNEGERKDFASQLPEELAAIALSVFPTEENTDRNILKQFAEVQGIGLDHAKKQLLSAWTVIKEGLTKGQIDHIRAQLPKQTVRALH